MPREKIKTGGGYGLLAEGSPMVIKAGVSNTRVLRPFFIEYSEVRLGVVFHHNNTWSFEASDEGEQLLY